MVKMCILSNFIYRCNAIWIKILANYFVDVNKLILKFTYRVKRLRITNTVQKEMKSGGMTLADLKIYYKAILPKTIWYNFRKKNKSIKQNRDPRKRHILMSSSYLWQRSRDNTEKIDFSTNDSENCTSIYKKKKKNLDADFIPFTESNLKWITDLNVNVKP